MKHLLLSLLLVGCSSGSFTEADDAETTNTSTEAEVSDSAASNGGDTVHDDSESTSEPPATSSADEDPAPEAPSPEDGPTDPASDEPPSDVPPETPDVPAEGGAGNEPVPAGGMGSVEPPDQLTQPVLLSQERSADAPELTLDYRNCDNMLPLSSNGLYAEISFINMSGAWHNYYNVEMCITSNGEAECVIGNEGFGNPCSGLNNDNMSCYFQFKKNTTFINDNFPEHGFTLTLTTSRDETIYKLEVAPFEQCRLLDFKSDAPRASIELIF